MKMPLELLVRLCEGGWFYCGWYLYGKWVAFQRLRKNAERLSLHKQKFTILGNHRSWNKKRVRFVVSLVEPILGGGVSLRHHIHMEDQR